MKKVFFTVGPSQLYPTYEAHMQTALKEQIGSLNHRGKEFNAIFESTRNNLKKLMDIPPDFHIFFLGSSLESMERTIQNTVLKTSFHILTGAFGKKWYQTSLDLGKKATMVNTPDGHGYDFGTLKIPKTSETVCITQNDTSTGVYLPMPEIYYLKSRYPDMLFALDLVSSAPYVDVDYKLIDMSFFSVQKGFGLPAGLGVLIVSPKALEKAQFIQQKGTSIGSYHSFLSFASSEKDLTTPETPNVLNIWLLNEVLKDMLKLGLPAYQRGIDKIRKDTDTKAKLIFDYFENHPKYSPFVKNKSIRSKTSIVIDVKGDSEKLRQKASKQGIIIGAGYGNYSKDHLRIANFPQHTIKEVKKLLKAIA